MTWLWYRWTSSRGGESLAHSCALKQCDWIRRERRGKLAAGLAFLSVYLGGNQ